MMVGVAEWRLRRVSIAIIDVFDLQTHKVSSPRFIATLEIRWETSCFLT